MKTILHTALCCGLALLCVPLLQAAEAAASSARENAPYDLSGYWVALVTEDWRFRMMVAPPGDYEGITLTAAGRALADSWEAEADLASGNACKAYGAGGIMRMPTRLNIAWTSDNVLSVATDAGRQNRVLKFGPAQDQIGIGSLQGVSHARWDLQREGRGGPVVNGTLEVVTTRMAPGYLRRNGVPYSEQARLTEYFELLPGEDGTDYLVVVSVLEDPIYLAQPVITSSSFRREADGSRWAPSECVVR
ncbi:MAG: hypothetical protein ACO3PV_01445 [Pseudohongiellaceae bacterium]